MKGKTYCIVEHIPPHIYVLDQWIVPWSIFLFINWIFFLVKKESRDAYNENRELSINFVS